MTTTGMADVTVISINATVETTKHLYVLHVEPTIFTILAIIAVLIITSNIFTIIVIAVTQKLRNVTGYLMISLAVADLGVGIMVTIPLIYAGFTTTLTVIACDVIGYLSSVSWMVSVYTLTLLSVDRLIAIVRPLQYINLVTTTRCLLACILVWLFAMILWIFPLVNIGTFKFNDEEVTCYFHVSDYPIQWILYMVIIFIPTSVAIGISYSWIWVISRQQKRLMEAVMNSDALTASRKNRKALRTLVIIVGAFYLAWTPFIIEHITKAILGRLKNIPEWLEIAIYIIAVTNSFWNPIIYIGTNRTFRGATFRVLFKVFSCCTCLHGNQIGDPDSKSDD